MSKDKDGKTFDDTLHTLSEQDAASGVALDDIDFSAYECEPADDDGGSDFACGASQEEDAAPAAGVKTRRPDGRKMGAASRRLRGDGSRNLRNRASIDWRQDQQRISQPFAQQGAEQTASIATLTQTLLLSRTAAALYTALKADGVSVIYDAQTQLSQYYPRAKGDGPAHVIALNPHHPKGDLLNLLARELRRAWQHAQGALVNPLTFEPDEAILVNRAQQADVLMMSIKMAWEQKLAGESEAWNYLAGSPMADVSRMFETKASTDFRTLNNGEAARAAYDKFFEGARTKTHDKRIIHQMLLDETGYIKSRQSRPQVTMDLFRRLGQLPNGRNYLAMGTDRLPTDPMYATVEDRSNANFLWFIKFERSFQEKEQQMIEESIALSAEVVDMAKWAAANRRPDQH